ncbi:hypothetical protein OC861_006262 [Tilletia horrida]|nr:hypothetical protein OC861_006262 [Tilletia horrida]
MATSRSALLLRAALPHIPTHGFTLNAVLAGVQSGESSASSSFASSQQHSRSTRTDHFESTHGENASAGPASHMEGAIAALFPGPPTAPTSVERTLFTAWDRDASARAFGLQDEQGDRAVGGSSSGSAADARMSGVESASLLLQERLASNEPVREHLLKAFALESAHALPTLPSFLSSRLPSPAFLPASLRQHLPSHPALPDPIPLLRRAARIADEAVSSSRNPQSWRENLDGPPWYVVRSHLAVAYLAGELHLLSPSASLASSQSLLARMATSPTLLDSLSSTGESLRSFLEWGGRSWIGILRSRGL